jgi:hypothetical protein
MPQYHMLVLSIYFVLTDYDIVSDKNREKASHTAIARSKAHT